MKRRNSWQIMADTVFALMIRELRTRFGASRLGYFWALAEPAAQAGIMGLLWMAMGRHALSGVPVILFMLSGVLPFKTFIKLLSQLSAAVQANKGLMSYRQVAPIDPLITRLLIEVATFVIVYFLFMLILAWFDYDVVPDNFLAVVAASFLLIAIATGLGVSICVAQLYWNDITKVVAMISMPMMLISGIFFSATMVPQQYWYLFSWNPVFHAIELSRDGFFFSYTTPVGSWEYLVAVTLVINAVALMLYQVNRQRFVAL